MENLIREIELILIEAGQHDKKKFRLGNEIRYAPYEVKEILLKHKNELATLQAHRKGEIGNGK